MRSLGCARASIRVAEVEQRRSGPEKRKVRHSARTRERGPSERRTDPGTDPRGETTSVKTSRANGSRETWCGGEAMRAWKGSGSPSPGYPGPGPRPILLFDGRYAGSRKPLLFTNERGNRSWRSWVWVLSPSCLGILRRERDRPTRGSMRIPIGEDYRPGEDNAPPRSCHPPKRFWPRETPDPSLLARTPKAFARDQKARTHEARVPAVNGDGKQWSKDRTLVTRDYAGASRCTPRVT